MDWVAAESHLKECEQAYSETGSAGLFCIQTVISPCRDRFNKGERSEELYNEILEIAL